MAKRCPIYTLLATVILLSTCIGAYNICLPAFKNGKLSKLVAKASYDDMGMTLAKTQEVLKSPKLERHINLVSPEGDDCSDRHHLCWHWALACECDRNPEFMSEHCPLSCRLCGMTDACTDRMNWCKEVVMNDYRYCYSQPLFALNMCRRTCHMCPGDCYDHNVSCSKWAKLGACQKNPQYMMRYCMKSCGSCDENTNNN